MGIPDLVRPMTWQRQAIRAERFTAPAVAVVASLVTIAPGSPKRGKAAAEGMDFYASVPRLMKLSHLCERSVRGALADLQRTGYLLQVNRGGRHGLAGEASTWRLTIPHPAPDADWESVDNPQEDVPNLDESGSQPAREAVPREKDLQERSSSSPQVPTEGAHDLPPDDDARKLIEDLRDTRAAEPRHRRRQTVAEVEAKVAAERARQLAALEAMIP